MQTESSIDNRRARGEATKSALMRAAEKLSADNGVENVSIREIVAEADQKNESALQYHFKNLNGLLKAIHVERGRAIETKRKAMLTETLERSAHPSLRDLCRLMIEPTFFLARGSAEFRRYVKAFGHQLALTDASPLNLSTKMDRGRALGPLLKAALPHLTKDDYIVRMESAIRLTSASMHHQARQRSAFRGAESDLFLNNLLDALSGLLSAPVSPETKKAKASQKKTKQATEPK